MNKHLVGPRDTDPGPRERAPAWRITMEAKLQSLKVAELKELLQAGSLPVTGNKADLVRRLLEHPEATQSLQRYVDLPTQCRRHGHE